MRSICGCFLLLIFLFTINCKRKNKANSKKKVLPTTLSRIHFKLQPMAEFSQADAKEIQSYLKAFYTHISINKAIEFPTEAYEHARNRYRGDACLKYFETLSKNDTVIVGLTNSDISVLNENNQSWGIMGLAYKSGSECINSTFRLNKARRLQQFKKIVLHEIGHTQGLSHCPNLTCMMQDAKGKNTTDQQIDFCANCKPTMMAKGWKL